MSEKARNFLLICFGFLFYFNLLAWFVVFDLQSRFLKVIFFDVGQGDSIFIEDPQGHQILIDGGPDSTILEKLGKTLPFYDRSIDLVILTHPEKDHLAGLIEVLKKYKIDYIIWTGVKRKIPEFEEWQNLILKENPEIKIAQAGRIIKAGEITFFIFHPFENLEGQEMEMSNDSSIVMKLVFNENDFLFTGDISGLIERNLVKREFNLDSDFLKVSHHGSKTSSSEEFIERVSPEVAVISVESKENVGGENCDNKMRNKYGHPNCQVLANLSKCGVKILRTDERGDIKTLSDGKNYKIETEK